MLPEPEPPDAARPAGDRRGLDEAVAEVYESLRKLARRVLPARSADELLDPTDLVHECYLRLERHRALGDCPRNELLAIAARTIRMLLVDHARELATLKRGGALRRVTLDEHEPSDPAPAGGQPIDLLDLEQALVNLAALDDRLVRVVELRFFAGLDVCRIAEVLAVSSRTVDRDWTLARAWLHRALGR